MAGRWLGAWVPGLWRGGAPVCPLLGASLALHTNVSHKASLLLQTLNHPMVALEGGLVVGFRWLTTPLCPTQKMVETQRQNVRTEFERLRCLLVEEEQRLLQRLEEEELEVLPPLQESVARLGQQSAQLADLVTELEGRCQLPALGLLQVSVGTWAETDGVPG